MFETLRIKNFRSIADSGPIQFSKLNVLLGCNNSGKSSILSILLLLKQTLLDKDRSTTLVTSGPLVDLGSYLDMVRSKPERTPLQIEFKLSRSTSFPFADVRFNVSDGKRKKASETKGTKNKERTQYDHWKLSFVYDPDRNEVVVQSFDVRDSISGSRIAGVRRRASWTLEGIPETIRQHTEVYFNHFIPGLRPKGPEPPKKIARQVLDFAFTLQMKFSLLEWQFQRLSYVGPIRERIPRYAILGTMPYSELTPSGQNLMRVLSSKAGRSQSKPLVKQLNRWLDRKFKMLRNVRIVNLEKGGLVKTLVAEDPSGKMQINLAATGAGVSQIVPVVVQTLLAPKDGCLIVEQPEIHLHPAAQTTLADLFLEHLQDGRQYVVETHSEHFVLRLRRRVAEGQAKADDLNLLFVEKTGSETKIRPLRIGRSGQFNEWPENFFEEGYQEAMALAEAGSRGN